jgi:hypothetical protein
MEASSHCTCSKSTGAISPANVIDYGSLLGVWGDIIKEGSIWTARGETAMTNPRNEMLHSDDKHLVMKGTAIETTIGGRPRREIQLEREKEKYLERIEEFELEREMQSQLEALRQQEITMTSVKDKKSSKVRNLFNKKNREQTKPASKSTF